MYCIGNAKDFRAQRGEGIINCDNDEMAASLISSASSSAQFMQDMQKTDLPSMTNGASNNTVGLKPTQTKKALKRSKKASIPFSTFSILEFVRYTRALVDDKQLNKIEVTERLNKVGLKRRINCRLKKLSPIEFRALSVASKINESTKSAYLNFEGLKYGRKNKKNLGRFLTHLAKTYKVFALVDDTRFVPKNVI